MSRKKYKNIMGFTLVELIITIVVVGILSIVSVAVYRGYVEKAIFAEGKALVGSIAEAQVLYYSIHGHWFNRYIVGYCEVLGIDARSNKYFRNFFVNNPYVATLPSSGPSKPERSDQPEYATICAVYERTDNDLWIVSVNLFPNGKRSDFTISKETSLERFMLY
jgi:prepilin-type N-terminal cleavage/methylation domain-containing protein